VLLGDGGQWWPEGEQREMEKSLRESKGRGRNLRERERDVGDKPESGRVRETEWREKKNKIIFFCFTIELQCDSTFRIAL